MAITRSTASRVRSGRIGDTVYYTSQGREISRAALNSSNYGAGASRTLAQQSRRVKWANLVNFYKASKGWMPKAFENKRAGVSDYNMLMKLNVNKVTVSLTKDQAASGGCVAEPLQISLGSLQPIEGEYSDGFYNTNIFCTLDEITAQTTIAELTENLLANNSWLRDNMQISWITYEQSVDAAGIPRVRCHSYELTLDTLGADLVGDFMPVDLVNTNDNRLAVMDDYTAIGCFAFVLSESVGGKTYVSTQTLVNNNTGLIALYSSAAQAKASIDSYGVDKDVFLDSGSEKQNARATTSQITAAVLAGINVVYNDGYVRYSDIANKTARLLLNFTPTQLSALRMEFVDTEDNLITAAASNVASAILGKNNIYFASLAFSGSVPAQSVLYRITIETDNGVSQFKALSSPHNPDFRIDGE